MIRLETDGDAAGDGDDVDEAASEQHEHWL